MVKEELEKYLKNYVREEGYTLARNEVLINNSEYTISTVYLGGIAKEFELIIFDDESEELYCKRFKTKEVANTRHNELLNKMIKEEFIICDGVMNFIYELEKDELDNELKSENMNLKMEKIAKEMKKCINPEIIKECKINMKDCLDAIELITR
ncbi:hypothetical protein [Clostridium baratii]|uniref:hypothetical protein n=1 Tax=Clostridium baratii TaxID=1561 RepID=UPI0022E4A544|nr:hypothetical protein [Clostridium baratii]